MLHTEITGDNTLGLVLIFDCTFWPFSPLYGHDTFENTRVYRKLANRSFVTNTILHSFRKLLHFGPEKSFVGKQNVYTTSRELSCERSSIPISEKLFVVEITCYTALVVTSQSGDFVQDLESRLHCERTHTCRLVLIVLEPPSYMIIYNVFVISTGNDIPIYKTDCV